METSAKDTINIDELFINTTKIFLERQQGNTNNKKDTKVLKGSKGISTDTTTPGDDKNKKKKGCCQK